MSFRVVTGARIVEQDDMIQIQIREGELLPNGKIRENTNEWQKLPKFRYDDHSVSGGSFEYYNEEDGEWVLLNKDVDYMFVGIENKIFLDELHVGKNYTVTGVRFNKDATGNGFQLETHSTHFEYATAELEVLNAGWESQKTMVGADPPAYKRARCR